MTALVVPTVGVVAMLGGLPRVAVIDATGEPVSAISDFLNTLLASGASPESVRSYALALLRWWRFLAAVAVPWEQATRVEVRDFVLWMRFTANPTIGARPSRSGGVNPGDYAPATINHNLAVLRSFYTDRIDAGLGPLVNPVPEALGRGGHRLDATTTRCSPSSGTAAHRCARSCRPDCRVVSGRSLMAATGHLSWPSPGSFSWPPSVGPVEI